MIDVEKVKEQARKFLLQNNCEDTYLHCVKVGECAYELGKNELRAPEQALIAGYLHDISAIYPNEKRVEAAQNFGVELNKEEYSFPMIIHQKLSKELAIREFGITDPMILSAIECHTTLKKDYSTLDLVVFVADKIKCDTSDEPPYLSALLAALDDSLERAAYVYIAFLLHQGVRVQHPWLMEAYQRLHGKYEYLSTK